MNCSTCDKRHEAQSIRTLFGVALLLAAAVHTLPASAQHGHGGGHGFSGHGYAGHGLGGHGYGGHGYSARHGGGNRYGVHGGLHGYSHYGYGHYGYGHDYGHSYAGHGYGLHDNGHGGDLHGYGYDGYYPHSFYLHYPRYYDTYPYKYWYPSFGVSAYPWYGLYSVDDNADRVVVNRPVIVDDQADDIVGVSTTVEQSSDPTQTTVSRQGRQYQQRAESAFRDGRYNEALRLVNHALVEMPRDGKLLLFVSQTLFATGDYRGAAAAVHQATTILDKDEWGHVVKNWRSYYRGAAYRGAMNKLNDYVKENPEAAGARFLRAYHFGFLGQEEFARKEMTKAVELESRDRLAAELLIMFGGDPPASVVDSSGALGATGSDSDHGTSNVQSDHKHGTHEHDADNH